MPDTKSIHREILLAFWKVHILHHAAEHGIVGRWMLQELRGHGYDVSPGTLYPLLRRMEAFGWLRSEAEGTGPRARRVHRITDRGREVLRMVRQHVRELGIEVMEVPPHEMEQP